MHSFPHLSYGFSQVHTVFYLIFVSLATDGILSTEKTLNTYLIKKHGFFLNKMIIKEALK